MLGIPRFHSLHSFSNIRDCDKWNEALDAKLYNKGKNLSHAHSRTSYSGPTQPPSTPAPSYSRRT